MKKAISLLEKIQISVGAICLCIFLVTVVIQIVTRKLGIAAMWTEDIAMYSFIWAVFMGAGAMVYEKRHFAFTSLSDMLKSKKLKSIIAIIISVIMLVFTVCMSYYGFMITKQFWSYKWVNIPMFNRGPVWSCVCICGVTSSIYLIEQIVEEIVGLVKGGNK